MSDDPLQERIRSGDAAALGEMIDRDREALLAYLAKITGEHLRSKTELEDLLQEVSAQAIASFDSAPLDRMPASAWLREIAQRKVVDAHRHFFEAKKRAGNREVAMDAPRGAGEDNHGLAEIGIRVRILHLKRYGHRRNERVRNSGAQ